MMSTHSARYNLSFKSVRTHFTTPTRSSVIERLPFAWENRFLRCEFKWYGSFRWILFGKSVIVFSPFIRNFRKFNSVPIVNNLMPCRLSAANICEKKCKISGNLGSNGSGQSDPFPWRGIVQIHLSKMFHGKLHSNGKQSLLHGNLPERPQTSEPHFQFAQRGCYFGDIILTHIVHAQLNDWLNRLLKEL